MQKAPKYCACRQNRASRNSRDTATFIYVYLPLSTFFYVCHVSDTSSAAQSPLSTRAGGKDDGALVMKVCCNQPGTDMGLSALGCQSISFSFPQIVSAFRPKRQSVLRPCLRSGMPVALRQRFVRVRLEKYNSALSAFPWQ